MIKEQEWLKTLREETALKNGTDLTSERLLEKSQDEFYNK
jgi:hypothetical protein